MSLTRGEAYGVLELPVGKKVLLIATGYFKFLLCSER